jgi:hypothetical protein
VTAADLSAHQPRRRSRARTRRAVRTPRHDERQRRNSALRPRARSCRRQRPPARPCSLRSEGRHRGDHVCVRGRCGPRPGPRTLGRKTSGASPAVRARQRAPFLTTSTATPSFLAGLDRGRLPDADLRLVTDTFRRFAEERIAVAEQVHRRTSMCPRNIISGAKGWAVSDLSVPRSTAASPGGGDYVGMVVATEGLSRGRSASAALAHHPARDPHAGRTRRHRGAEAPLAAALADGSVMLPLRSLSPDFGSDVAGIRQRQRRPRHAARRLEDQRRQDLVHVRRSLTC